MKLFEKIIKAGDGKRVKAIQSVVGPINSLEAGVKALSDTQLRGKTAEFKERVANGESLDSLMAEAFAVVREGAIRVLGQRHYDVQLMGGAALHWGWVAEMKTGEGKTLVSTLPAYLNALSGESVHIVTVNDYLASRDAEQMGRVHGFLGLSVGLVVPDNSDSADKKRQYNCDITYGTNNEFGFDYLRDNMARDIDSMAQRGHAYALVDEIDSILIDEARTPLIISGKVKGEADLYHRFADVVMRLSSETDYEVDEEKRVVAMTDDGITAVEKLLGISNLYDGVQQDLVHQLSVALRAKELFRRDKDYLIADDQVKIVDEFTGRVLDGRRWSDGLHQAVEAKEGVKIKEEQQTLATVTLQNYFRSYDKLAGMTGTALSDAAELETTYGLAVVQIPTNKPLIRMDKADLIYKTEDSKFEAVCSDLAERVAKGQPVLVGTASVAKSEKLSKFLTNMQVKHEVMNAKKHFSEAEVVAQAGQPGAVTVATNMAGRGVDIILGGNAEKLAERDVLAEGYDPDSGDGQAYAASRLAYWEPICKREGERVIEAGGLYVLGTERHESRRIDNQLRGRSGRQGDPGESRFYLSLEDELMRIFGGNAMKVMDRALPDGVPIESKMVTKSVERAQNTVEQKNAESRKNVLEYDEVYDQQRKVIYKRRFQILDNENLRDASLEAMEEAVSVLVQTYCVSELEDDWDLEGLVTELTQFWPTKLTPEDLEDSGELSDLTRRLAPEGLELYEAKEAEFGEENLRQVERQIMLQLIDQRWREHLTEMAALRDGINLRAMGQRDPLTEWKREGFDLFSEMVTSLNLDFVKYLMHVQIVTPTETADQKGRANPTAANRASDSETVPDDSRPRSWDTESGAGNGPVSNQTSGAAASPAKAGSGAPGRAPVVPRVTDIQTSDEYPEEDDGVDNKTVVTDQWDRTPRNSACPCGSGNKFKLCHGR